MERLLTDEALRLRFAINRIDTLGELQDHWLELAPNEIDLSIESDVQMVFDQPSRRQLVSLMSF